jgi:hypothetical protein
MRSSERSETMTWMHAAAALSLCLAAAGCAEMALPAAAPANPFAEVLSGRARGTTVATGPVHVVCRLGGDRPSDPPRAYVVDGRVYSAAAFRAVVLDARDVERVELVKPAEAVARFGPVAADGAFLVTTRGERPR